MQSFNDDISRWDTSNVITTTSMFCGARVFNGDLSRWDTSNVPLLLRACSMDVTLEPITSHPAVIRNATSVLMQAMSKERKNTGVKIYFSI